MADPFEVRMRFTSQLQHLNASVTSAQKAANYALKYSDMDEDLHSCILEQLERNNMNNRANILYFIEHLCYLSSRENHFEFINMIKRDILHIVEAVAPEDGTGAANLKVVRRVLTGLYEKQIIESSTLDRIRGKLGDEEITRIQKGLSMDGSTSSITQFNNLNGGVKLDRKQIEQRIEEDRERHKRLRENLWAVSAEDGHEQRKIWDEASDCGDDDWIAAMEDRERRNHSFILG